MTNTTTRQIIKTWIADQTQYDADTLRISQAGEVSAILDANKTFSGPHNVRVIIDSLDGLMAEIKRYGE